MLGTDHQHSHMFSYMSPEARALREKTIRSVRLSLWPETGFGEIAAQAALSIPISPPTGLLARVDGSPS